MDCTDLFRNGNGVKEYLELELGLEIPQQTANLRFWYKFSAYTQFQAGNKVLYHTERVLIFQANSWKIFPW